MRRRTVEAVAASIAWLREQRLLPAPVPCTPPRWWHEPIFCGWGQMRYEYRLDHEGSPDQRFLYPRLGQDRRELIATPEPVWGVELLHRWISLLHQGVKATKPDAC